MASFRFAVIRAGPLLSLEEFCFSSPFLLLKIQRNRKRTKGRGKRANLNVHVKATAVPKCAIPCLRLQLYLLREAWEDLSSEPRGCGAAGWRMHPTWQRVSLRGVHGFHALSSLCLAVSEWGMEEWSSFYTCLCPHLSNFKLPFF